ncbi:hypothetical protein Sango_1030400 [Sesamum angolense]|uniref:Uncharacterized protein n=1 Tax=Sesamum angolense TaxID=2727404 RepID=A0AAE1X160_9LAMI|nr:hypothetical protein Sango_1030400 [Sesamum angolense]
MEEQRHGHMSRLKFSHIHIWTREVTGHLGPWSGKGLEDVFGPIPGELGPLLKLLKLGDVCLRNSFKSKLVMASIPTFEVQQLSNCLNDDNGNRLCRSLRWNVIQVMVPLWLCLPFSGKHFGYAWIENSINACFTNLAWLTIFFTCMDGKPTLE